MSGILRLSNDATGQSTLDTNATTDVTYSLPDTGLDKTALILTDKAHEVTSINWDGIAVNIQNGDINLDNGTLFVDESTNQVGIGTTSPERNLTVQNSSTIVAASLVSNPSNISYLLFGDTDADAQGRVQYDNSSDSLQLYSNGSEAMLIDSSGRVGVGTSSPSQLLHIYQVATNSQAYQVIENNRSRNAATEYRTTLGSWYVGNGVGADINRFTIYQGGTGDRFVIDSSGNVGIGTTSPAAALHVKSDAGVKIHASSANTTAVLEIAGTRRTGAAAVAISKIKSIPENPTGDSDDTSLAFETRSQANQMQEAMRIDSSGRLLVGTSSAPPIKNSQSIYVSGTGSNDSGIQCVRWNPDFGGYAFGIGRSRSGTIGSYSSVSKNDNLGSIIWYGDDGTDLNSQAASINAEVDGNTGSSRMPGRLVFSTTNDGEDSPSQKVRIDSLGTQTNQFESNVGTTYRTYYQKNIGGLSTTSIATRTVQLASYDFDGQYTITVMGKHSNQNSYISAKAIYVCGAYGTGSISPISNGGYQQTSHVSISWSETGGSISVTITTSSASGPSYVLIAVEGVGYTRPKIYRNFDSSEGFIDVLE